MNEALEPARPLVAIVGLLVVCVVLGRSAGGAAPAGGAPGEEDERQAALKAAFDRERLRIMDDYCADLEKEVEWALKRLLRNEARDIVKRMIRVHRAYRNIEDLKKTVTQSRKPPAGEDLSGPRETLASRLEKVYDKQARRLYSLTEKCFRAGLFTDAFDLLDEILDVAPDPKNRTHRKARAVLGYAWDRETETWITQWEKQRRKSHVLTPEGWVRTRDKKKWDQGLRPLNDRWVSEEEERAARTRNAFNPYTVETEHFVVQTNLGRQQGVKYAEVLESFQRAFYKVFISYYDHVAGAKLLFRQTKPTQHVVYVFPSRVDYLDYVKARKGNDELLRRSAGFYTGADRVSRLYWADDDEETYSTLFHEVAHQLFAESKETSGGSSGNNWVPEGLGTYVETWALRDGAWYPGRRTTSRRLQEAGAILRAQGDSFTVGDFVRIGHEEFHRPDVRGGNYALACALTHFFMHYESGTYRDAFMQFVSAYYAGRVHEGSLGESIEVEGADTPAEALATLDRQFKSYMKSLEAGSSRRKKRANRS